MPAKAKKAKKDRSVDLSTTEGVRRTQGGGAMHLCYNKEGYSDGEHRLSPKARKQMGLEAFPSLK